MANFSESLGMQFAIVHVGEDEETEGSNDGRHPVGSLVGNVKVGIACTMYIHSTRCIMYIVHSAQCT